MTGQAGQGEEAVPGKGASRLTPQRLWWGGTVLVAGLLGLGLRGVVAGLFFAGLAAGVMRLGRGLPDKVQPAWQWRARGGLSVLALLLAWGVTRPFFPASPDDTLLELEGETSDGLKPRLSVTEAQWTAETARVELCVKSLAPEPLDLFRRSLARQVPPQDAEDMALRAMVAVCQDWQTRYVPNLVRQYQSALRNERTTYLKTPQGSTRCEDAAPPCSGRYDDLSPGVQAALQRWATCQLERPLRNVVRLRGAGVSDEAVSFSLTTAGRPVSAEQARNLYLVARGQLLELMTKQCGFELPPSLP